VSTAVFSTFKDAKMNDISTKTKRFTTECINCKVLLCRPTKTGLCRSCVQKNNEYVLCGSCQQMIKVPYHISFGYHKSGKVYTCKQCRSRRSRTRQCPQCEKDIVHSSSGSMYTSRKRKSLCFECYVTKYGIPYKRVNNKLVTNYGIHPKRKDLHRECPQCGKDIYYTRSSSLKAAQGKLCHSCSSRFNMRNIDRKKMLGFKPISTDKEIHFIECLNNGIPDVHFIHSRNGGQVKVGTYFVDGYDRRNNIVFEYFEPWHNHKDQVRKDFKRLTYIKRKLDCNIWIYNERNESMVYM
jgi:predicted RNA-binding Zn-ribbon protein involved in translation (DUF1610 family)